MHVSNAFPKLWVLNSFPHSRSVTSGPVVEQVAALQPRALLNSGSDCNFPRTDLDRNQTPTWPSGRFQTC